MQEQTLVYHPIGIIHSPFRDIADRPIQPAGTRGVVGTVLHIEDMDIVDGTPCNDTR
jgi:tRNA (Thr-GGU) A37 N-methylase